MGFTNYQLILAFSMFFSGSLNTVATKQACIVGFLHPYVLSWCMFVGEILCLITFKTLQCAYSGRRAPKAIAGMLEGNQNFSPFLMYVPALFDMFGTSIMYIGLTLTYSSTFQMLRGSIIVFVAILSVLLLKRRLCLREWIGIFIILIGLLTVGYSDFRDRKGVKKGAETHTNSEMTVGVILIVLSQAIIAMQMVYEEKFVYKYNIPPLQAVGWEGVFGFLTLSVLIVPMNFITLPDQEHTMEDIPLALNKFGSDWTIGGLLLVSIISIAIFNYSGLSVTKELSATSRMVLDSMRTILVWGAELIFGWKLFDPMQLIGFAVLLVGMCAYNDIILPQVDQILRRMRKLPHKESSKHVSPYDGNSQQQNLSRQNSSASNSKNQNV